MFSDDSSKAIKFLLVVVFLIFFVLSFDLLKQKVWPFTLLENIIKPSSFPIAQSPQPNDSSVRNTASLKLFLTKIEKHIGNVTGTVEYLKDQSTQQITTFQISLDTHSVNLDAFDFQKDIRFENNGNEIAPSSAFVSGSGHHRNAKVTFPIPSIPFTIRIMSLDGVAKTEFVFSR